MEVGEEGEERKLESPIELISHHDATEQGADYL